MQTPSIQSVFLGEVKKRLPAHIAFADELSEILSISRDSAYRRIRGETVLSLDEVSSICKHYRISLDQIISPSSEMVSFHNRFVTEMDFNFEKWLKSIEGNIDTISSFPDGEMIISAKDVPLFYYFNTPLLSAFKMFFWMKSILRYQDYQEESFRPELVPRPMLALGQRIYEKFTVLRRTELWSEDTIHATIRQIEFYHDCGLLTSPEQGHQLCDELVQVIRNVRESAAASEKDNGALNLFKNEILIADNTYLFRMGDKLQLFINHNTLNILSTTQESFCLQTENYLKHLLNKATKISGTGEKERMRFFNNIEDKIRTLRKRMADL